MSYSAGLVAFKLQFEISPIIFVGGIAANVPGGMLPIISITESASFEFGLLSGSTNIDLSDFFAYFRPLPGATLLANEIGKYPFANSAVAANAVIRQPNTLSMLMLCPARDEFAYANKLTTMISLQSALDQHTAQGGTFNVCTPSYLYTNMLLTRFSDASLGDTKQVQNAWQWDFESPLLAVQQAQQVQNNLMSQFTNGGQISGQPAWSGLSPTVGNASSLAGPGLLPSTTNLVGTNTAPLNPTVP